MVTQLHPKRLLDHQNRLEGFHIDVAEEPLEPPPHALPGHAKGFVDLLAIGALEDHATGPAGFEFNP